MRGSFTPALLAASSIGALAAPVVERRDFSPFSFSVPVKPLGQGRDIAQEMQRAANKFSALLKPFEQPLSALEGLLGMDSGSGTDLPFGDGDSDPLTGLFGSSSGSSSGASSPSSGSSSGSPSNAPFSSSSAASGSSQGTSSPAPQSNQPSTSTSGGSSSGNVAANPNENNSEYLAPVTIGGQAMELDFDTGSADLWVFSTKIEQSEAGQHTLFDPSKSKTWSNYQGASWQIQYGDGSEAYGSVGFDHVQVGTAIVPKQAVELAEQVSPSFVSDSKNDGLLGLAFSSLNTVKPRAQNTWFENVKSSLAKPLFTVDLREDQSGSYDFGSIDSSKYTGEIQYTAVNASSGFWQFSSPSYVIGGDTYACRTCNPAIADTGTSLLLMDADVVNFYYQNTDAWKDSNSGFWVYPCGSTLPDIGVAVGGFTVTLPGSALAYNNMDGTCYSGLQESPTTMQIFGDVLLRHFFAVFDGTTGAERFGLAQKPFV